MIRNQSIIRVLAFSISLGMAPAAAAQSNSPFYKTLLQTKEVRAEVGVSDEQYQEFLESEVERKTLLEAEFRELREMEKEFPSDLAERDEFLSKLQAAYQTATMQARKVEERELARIFGRKQVKRMAELRLQLLGLSELLVDPYIRDEVGFSASDAEQLEKQMQEFSKQLASEINAQKQKAVEAGIPATQVNRLWRAMEHSEREVDHVLDALTEEQEEMFERVMRTSFSQMKQRRTELEDELQESLPKNVTKKLEKLRGEPFAFPPNYKRSSPLPFQFQNR